MAKKPSASNTVKKKKPVKKLALANDTFALDLIERIDKKIKSKKGVGAPVLYEPIALWDIFTAYCKWITAQPAKRDKPFGTGFVANISTPRPMTLQSFYAYAGMSRQTFENYEGREEYLTITTHIRGIIFTQKFDGAVRGEFDSRIIARELGIGDRLDIGFDPSTPITIEFGKGNDNAPLKKKTDE